MAVMCVYAWNDAHSLINAMTSSRVIKFHCKADNRTVNAFKPQNPNDWPPELERCYKKAVTNLVNAYVKKVSMLHATSNISFRTKEMRCLGVK